MNISDEERQRRREQIYEVKPWIQSTGATSVEGKAKSAQNARKHGRYAKKPKQPEMTWLDILKYAESLQDLRE